jgi:anti-anti-sigma regulatory factor
VGTVRRVREIGGTVVLCAASPAVSRALSLSGLSRIVDITADLDEARRLLDPSPVVPTPSSGRALRP